jgi:hypothetical protein
MCAFAMTAEIEIRIVHRYTLSVSSLKRIFPSFGIGMIFARRQTVLRKAVSAWSRHLVAASPLSAP